MTQQIFQTPGPETLVTEHLATCLAAMQDCLAQSRRDRTDDEYGHQRRNDLAYVAKLMKASARLTTALARLKGDNKMSIHVTHGAKRDAEAMVDKRGV